MRPPETVELYATVRRAVQVEGMSQREAAWQLGLVRATVREDDALVTGI